MNFDSSELKQLFGQQFGDATAVRFFQAPGRVNLIGEHTDYNDGFVMPSAIDFHTWIAAAPSGDDTLTIHSVDFAETVSFDLREQAPQPKKHWSDYVVGVAVQLRNARVPLGGANLLITGNVPLGSGLSSSASIEIATAHVLSRLAGHDVDLTQLSLLCQRAENEFVGARCGIMDQFIAAHGQRDHALLLDCRSLEYRLYPLPKGVSLVICNSMVKHSIASGEYNVRRQECERGVELLQGSLPGIKALRDVSMADLERHADELPPVVYRRCRHVVGEDERTLAAAEALKQKDLSELGRLMRKSHESLRDDYEVSCPELDALAEIAWEISGVIGARMTGGGFGGCTINLVRDEAVDNFQSEIARQYDQRFGITPDIYVTKASDGVSELR